uniref:Uncharacterized protein n=1 Tax=Setaria italica TaxID=4555 RepID=K3Z1C3_SETIT
MPNSQQGTYMLALFPCLLLDAFGCNSLMLSMFSVVLFDCQRQYLLCCSTLCCICTMDVACMFPCVSLPFFVTPNGFR